MSNDLKEKGMAILAGLLSTVIGAVRRGLAGDRMTDTDHATSSGLGQDALAIEVVMMREALLNVSKNEMCLETRDIALETLEQCQVARVASLPQGKDLMMKLFALVAPMTTIVEECRVRDLKLRTIVRCQRVLREYRDAMEETKKVLK